MGEGRATGKGVRVLVADGAAGAGLKVDCRRDTGGFGLQGFGLDHFLVVDMLGGAAGGGATLGAGCGGATGSVAVVVRGNVSRAANIAGMVAVALCIGAGTQHRATHVAGVIGVGVRVCAFAQCISSLMQKWSWF